MDRETEVIRNLSDDEAMYIQQYLVSIRDSSKSAHVVDAMVCHGWLRASLTVRKSFRTPCPTLCPRKDQVLPFDDDSPIRMSRGRSLLDFVVWLEQWAALAIGHSLRWSNLVVDFPDDVSGIP